MNFQTCWVEATLYTVSRRAAFTLRSTHPPPPPPPLRLLLLPARTLCLLAHCHADGLFIHRHAAFYNNFYFPLLYRIYPYP